MENEPRETNLNPSAQNAALINSFCEITSSSKEEALFFLESHQWDLDAAVSTFLDSAASAAPAVADSALAPPSRRPPSASPSDSPVYSPSQSPSRSRSPSPAPARPPYELRSRRSAGRTASGNPARGIRTFADLNQAASEQLDDDSDQDYYTGGEKSGMLVREPSKPNDVDEIFDQARQLGAVAGSADSLQPSSSSRSFTGTARLLSGETVSHAPPPPEFVSHSITFWRNGFTVDDGPLRELNDPENASFLESIMKSQCPEELKPADMRTKVDLHLIKRDEDYSFLEPQRRHTPFQGVGRTLGSSSTTNPATSEVPVSTSGITTAPLPSAGLVVDSSLPTTSIQLRLADGTRMISRFNHQHTIRDIRGFIDASRPGGERNYQLMTMGFPPKQLTDLDQTIEQAGIANSVVIQKF